MNINEVKELVKHCVYEEKGIVCMNDTYYNDMIHTMENLQSKIDKAFELLQLLHHKFKDEDSIHNEIEDIQKCLKEDK